MLAFALLVSDVGPLLWGLVPIAAGLYFFSRGFSVLARRRLITSTPQSKIRSAAVGLVEVSGLAVGPHTVHAPISGLPCFYYRTIAWEHKDSGKSNDWQKVAEEILYVPFFLDDGTGKLLIDPRGAELDLHRDFRHEFSDSIFSTADSVPYNVRNFLLRHGVSSESKVRVEEYCIKPKNALFIVGTLAENPQYRGNPQASNPSRIAVHRLTVTEHASTPPEVIYISPATTPASSMQMTQQEKVAAALLKAGITKPAAWEAAGLSPSSVAVETARSQARLHTGLARQLPLRMPIRRRQFDVEPPVVLMKGRNDKTLLISWRSERALARLLAWKSMFMLSGGPALILLGVYFLLARMQWL